MTTDNEVRRCLQDIAKVDMELTALIQDIRNCASSKEELDEINSKTREKINILRQKIKDLEQIGQEQIKDSDRQLVLSDVERHKKSLMSTIVMVRKANVETQKRVDSHMKEELLDSSSRLRQRSSMKQSLVKSAGDITDSLMSISSSLAAQVDRSRNTIDSLVLSSKVVRDTHEEFKVMEGHIHGSRKLLTKYGRREFTDKLILLLALLFFLACILYIIKKRMWT